MNYLTKNLIRCFVGLAILGSVFLTATAQDQKRIDSLEVELRKIDLRKLELGIGHPGIADTLSVNLLSELSSSYWGNNPDKSLAYAKQALVLSENLGFKKGIANAYSSMGVVSSDKGEYFEAHEFYKKSLSIFTEIGNKRGVAVNYNNIGIVFQNQGNYPEALNAYLSSLKLQEEIGSKKGMSISYNSLGSIYHKLGNLIESLKNYKSALSINMELDRKKGIAYNYNNIGDIYREQGNYEEALKNFKASVEIKEEMGDRLGIAGSYNNMGIVYSAIGDFPGALKSHFAALEIQLDIGDQKGEAASYSNIGSVYFSLKRHNDALYYLNKSLTLAKSLGLIERAGVCYDYLTSLDSARGNFRGAFENYKMYAYYQDSLVNEENSKKTVQVQMLYEFDKKEALAEADHKKEIVLKQTELARQKTIRKITTAGFASGFLVLAVIGILLFTRFKLKKKIEGQQAIIEERVRISRELHDDVGAQLSTAKLFLKDLKKNLDGENGRELLDNSLGILETSINDLRVVMEDLRQSTLKDKGYLIATEELVKQIKQNSTVKFTLSHHGISQRLPPEMEHHLYRVTQELINNSLKYANAAKVSIDVVRQTGKIVFIYEDDGKGFETKVVKKGYGLNNIESRVKSLDGLLELTTSPGGGFCVLIEIPYQGNNTI